MIKEAIEKIIEIDKPEFKEINGEIYSNKQFIKIKQDDPVPSILEINTLTGIIDYIKNDLDEENEYLIHVKSYNEVRLYGRYKKETAERNCYLVSIAPEFKFGFNQWYDSEKFNINMQSQFLQDEVMKNMLSITGNISVIMTKDNEDDGITQKVIVKTGIVKKQETSIINPIRLTSMRTFTEIPQPSSLYVLRARQVHNGIEFALFESDGGSWEHEVMLKIAEYLRENLPVDFKKKISIIA
jgi:hypothetical protein